MNLTQATNTTIFNICSPSPIYNDITETLRFGLTELGYQVHCLSAIVNSAVNILLGSQTFGNWEIVPRNSILFNMEQMGSSSLYITDTYIDQLRKYTVWDYSQRNVDWLKNQGINDAAIYVPIGYAPALSRIDKSADQDIDVLFYGWLNERRQAVLNELERRGLKVVALNNSFGAELDAYISRAKVVVNIHFYETKIFEIIRVSYLLSNKKAVVSEVEPDTEIDPELRGAVVGVPYHELADGCQMLVNNAAQRCELEEKAVTVFARRSQAAYLMPAIEALFQSIPIKTPLISVVIPCYNQAHFLRDSVESVLNQTYKNVEILIVNDGSQDATTVIANGLISEYPGCAIRLLEKSNGGLARARNYGISYANGEFILPLDADDKIHPDMLRKCADILLDDPGVSIAYTDYQHFGDADLVVNTPEYSFEVLYKERCLHTATALYRKKAWEDAGGYNPNMIWGTEDWEFWINCGKNKHFGKRIPEVLFYYRAKFTEQSMLRDCKKYTNEIFARMFLNQRELYEDIQVANAQAVWSAALVKMVDTCTKGSKEYFYLCNLDAMQLQSEVDILTATGKSDKAIDLYNLWLENNGSTALAYAIYFNLGVFLHEAGRLMEAQEAVKRSLVLRPGFEPSRALMERLSTR